MRIARSSSLSLFFFFHAPQMTCDFFLWNLRIACTPTLTRVHTLSPSLPETTGIFGDLELTPDHDNRHRQSGFRGGPGGASSSPERSSGVVDAAGIAHPKPHRNLLASIMQSEREKRSPSGDPCIGESAEACEKVLPSGCSSEGGRGMMRMGVSQENMSVASLDRIPTSPPQLPRHCDWKSPPADDKLPPCGSAQRHASSMMRLAMRRRHDMTASSGEDMGVPLVPGASGHSFVSLVMWRPLSLCPPSSCCLVNSFSSSRVSHPMVVVLPFFSIAGPRISSL